MFTRILVASDFSATSEAAIDCARELALRLGASLHLLHVVDDPAGAARRGDAEQGLAARLTPEDRRVLRATTDVLVGPVAPTIVEMASSRDADLIVMGTHGRSGLAHALIGSVAERVVRTADCPVLTVRARP